MSETEDGPEFRLRPRRPHAERTERKALNGFVRLMQVFRFTGKGTTETGDQLERRHDWPPSVVRFVFPIRQTRPRVNGGPMGDIWNATPLSERTPRLARRKAMCRWLNA